MVSVIIPVLNREKGIKKCLKSIMNQNYKNIEIVVIDNGSTDNTVKIIKELQEKDKRIKLFVSKLKGVSNARNFGLKKSTGDYIMFVDSDDTIDKEMISTMMKIAKQNHFDIVKCGYKLIHGSKIENFCLKEGLYDFDEQFWKEFFSTYNYNQVWGQLINKKICNGITFNSNVSMAEDYLFNYYLYKKANSIYIIESPFYNYYYNESGMNYNKDINKIIKKIEDILYVCKELSKSEQDYRWLINNRLIYEILPHVKDAFLNEQFKIEQLDFLFKDKFYNDALKDISYKYNPKKYFLAFIIKKKKYKTLKFFFKLINYIKRWLKK